MLELVVQGAYLLNEGVVLLHHHAIFVVGGFVFGLGCSGRPLLVLVLGNEDVLRLNALDLLKQCFVGLLHVTLLTLQNSVLLGLLLNGVVLVLDLLLQVVLLCK